GGLHDAGQPTIEAAAAVGRMLRDLHDAAASFQPPVGAVWKDWHARSLGAAERIIGHCDAAPWNVVVRDGMPVAFIDWELAGPVDPLVDLAQASWLNANLYDDDVVRRQRLPPLDFRLRQLRALVDAYGLLAARRAELVERIIEFAVSDTAWQADGAGVTPDSVDLEPAWALAWRARAANWLLRHRDLLRDAL
ncbi:MAG: aminoglycoside phosphotransferase family protein, partial [SAR202 cluster bacterium]|nr:aminoglycoside phosphotransferase family protein [SAR202 cluster bacterium]